jgi:NitT/TauT family transport system substrate-binding protein
VLTLAECRYRIVARRSAGIVRLADLRDKHVAATANTSSEYYLSRVLARNHLKESDIRFVSLEGQEMPEALSRHTVDAVSIWEPHAENSLRAIGNDAVVFEDPAAYTERFNLNSRSDVLANDAKRDSLLALLREIQDSSSRIRSRRTEMILLLAPKIGYPEPTVLAVWNQFTFPASLDSGLRSALIGVESWTAATRNRQPRSRRDLDVLIDSSLLEQDQSQNPQKARHTTSSNGSGTVSKKR